jgi:spore germination cell wall hydrolase CwlJ-like protein
MTIEHPAIKTPITPEVDLMARTLDGEAESGGALAMRAVACVIMNRVNNPRWWGRDITSVIRMPYQFSCWLPGIDCKRIEGLAQDDPWYLIAVGISQQAIDGQLIDITNGADSYYAKSMTKPPPWAHTAPLTYQDAWQRYYRTELPAPTAKNQPCAPGTPVTTDKLNQMEIDKIDKSSKP